MKAEPCTQAALFVMELGIEEPITHTGLFSRTMRSPWMVRSQQSSPPTAGLGAVPFRAAWYLAALSVRSTRPPFSVLITSP